MSVASSVAIAVAERVERTGGPRAGLVAWRALANKSTDGETRGKALIAALRCAIALRDLNALSELTLLWEGVDRGVWDEPITTLCKDMIRAGLMSKAIALAQTEAHRHKTGRALYLHARLLDLAGEGAAAAEAFRATIVRAQKEGATQIEQMCHVRRAAILSRSVGTLGEALEDARLVDLAKVEAASRLIVARVLLESPSRFVRAGALGTLDEIANADGSPPLATRALVTVARWVDDAGEDLTPLELDRVVAIFSRERVLAAMPRAKDVARALDAILRANTRVARETAVEAAAKVVPSLEQLHSRARDVLRGRVEVPVDRSRSREELPKEAALRRSLRERQVLDVTVAIRDRAPARAASVLNDLTAAMTKGEILPRGAVVVAHHALQHDDQELQESGVKFFEQRLARASLAGAPPRGYLALADLLAARGREDLSGLARRAAAIRKEPGATESLGTALTRTGWELARSGKRDEAIKKLREAKAMLEPKS
jgi:hypothetical protein